MVQSPPLDLLTESTLALSKIRTKKWDSEEYVLINLREISSVIMNYNRQQKPLVVIEDLKDPSYPRNLTFEPSHRAYKWPYIIQLPKRVAR